AAGNLLSLTDAGGTVTYTYDAVNNLSTLTEPGGQQTTFGYDTRDNRTSTSLPNGVTAAQTFDAADRVTAIRAIKTGAGSAITDFGYDYRLRDADGNLVLDGSGNAIDTDLRFRDQDQVRGLTTNYRYDALDRLTQAHTTTGSGATQDRFTYAFDANSNRTSRTHNGAETTYSYNAANELERAGTTTFGYDANGNPLTSSAGLALGYNAKDQMDSIRAPGNSYTEQFTYAGADHWERVQATGHPDGTFTYTNTPLGVTQLSGTNGYSAHYVRDDQGTLVGLREGTSTRRYYLTDALGSIVALADASGDTSATYRYDPDGNNLGTTGSADQPWRFAGQHRDTTGLYKIGKRYYDPATGRWTQQDPLEQPLDAREANRYLYAAADPVNNV
ncbi:MAG: RHS repeat-associated core domain-containing protein, partial [Nocardioidaceae bacterium]